MRIAGLYSFNRGQETVEAQYADELKELEQVVEAVDATRYKTKVSREKTMPGRLLFSPRALNRAFTAQLKARGGWQSYKVPCDYPTQYYAPKHAPAPLSKGAFREIDFVKNKLGLEVQFGKYAFMVYNVCAKMTIFHNLGIIDAGVEIVPLKVFAEEMSSGVSYFEQFVWDLEHRGVSDIDIPVLILGVCE
ncbi:MAG: restriction endonuclease [Planctomycetes bacterium]|nr:restriction endonuclease [Planctomycetota bacterium]